MSLRYKGAILSTVGPTSAASGEWTARQQMQLQGAGVWPMPPGAPTIGTATAGSGSASVGFTAPSYTGYPAGITSYTVTSSPGGFTGTGASSPITVSGLTNGTAYTFTVTATNATGTGPASAASNSVTPAVPNYVEDVFSTYLYTGNGVNQNITNGISLGGGNTSGSVYFPTTSTYLSTSNSISLSTGNFTFECWVNKLDTNTNNNSIFTIDDALNSTGLQAYIVNSNIRLYNAGGVILNVAMGVSTVVNGWTHIAIVKNSGTVNAYVNGTSAGSVALSNSLSGALTVGAQKYNGSTGSAWVGNIASFRLTNTAVYTANFNPPTTALTAISGTQFLALQGATPFVDQSVNTYAITQTGSPVASTTGPFSTSGVGSGGMVWIKSRTAAYDNTVYDTARGTGGAHALYTDTTDPENAYPSYQNLTSFNNDGYSVGVTSSTNLLNDSGINFASWTFRKQPKFFDVVTFTIPATPTNSNRRISQSLGSVPGFIMVKVTDAGDNWKCYHQDLGINKWMNLNTTGAAYSGTNLWGTSAPTSTDFGINENMFGGGTFVAYVFAHNAGGFGTSGADNVISCGSYTGTNATQNITLGYEPQLLLVKNITTAVTNWFMMDTMRGLNATNKPAYLYPNAVTSEGSPGPELMGISSTGFVPTSGNAGVNASGSTYIYIAIRRGPMKVPTSGTTVFLPNTITGTGSTRQITNVPFAPDALYSPGRGPSGSVERGWYDRLRGINNPLQTNSAGTEDPTYASTVTAYNNNGVTLGGSYAFVNQSGSNYIEYFFGRAPSFFDEVCYTGTGSAHAETHNLGVAPELALIKRRTSTTGNWAVGVSFTSTTSKLGYLNSDGDLGTAAYSSGSFFSAQPTSTTFTVGTDTAVNLSGSTYIAYLFATCAGVSKVGSYTGTGTLTTVDCGFAGGARFVMIKKTSGTGNWFMWDTARGMTAGTDPSSPMNLATAETNANSVYTITTGFQLLASPAADVNTSGTSYIYLAIA